MAKTLQDRFVISLKGQGWTEDPKARSRKYVTLTKDGELHKLFAGPSGSLRRGEAYSRSIPVSDKIKAALLEDS